MSCAKCFRMIVALCILDTFCTVVRADFQCGAWSTWYNSSTPAMYNGSKEIEEVPIEVLSVCRNGRRVKCRDDKGEPFIEKYNATSGDKMFVYSCSGEFGVTCFVISPNGTCRDYAVQFYCDCPTTKDATTITMVSSDMTSPKRDMPTKYIGHSVFGTATWYPGIGNESSVDNSTDVSGNGRAGYNSGNCLIISKVLLFLLPMLSWDL